MISFRSHIASLVAVFLALAVGIVLGAGPLQGDGGGDGGGDGDAVELADAEAEVARLKRAADFNDAYARATRSKVLPADLLKGRSITLVTLPNADEDQVTEMGALASSLGATVVGRVTLDDKLVDVANRQLVEQLGARLRASVGDAVDVPATSDGYEQIGLLLGHAVVTDAPAGSKLDGAAEEILASLTTAELVTTDTPLQRRGSLALIVAGEPRGNADQRRGAGDILGTLATALDESGKGAVVAGPIPSGARDGVVGAVRRSRAASRVSTVDVTDHGGGIVLTVLALAGEDAGTTRHLGTAASEDGAYPRDTKR